MKHFQKFQFENFVAHQKETLIRNSIPGEAQDVWFGVGGSLSVFREVAKRLPFTKQAAIAILYFSMR